MQRHTLRIPDDLEKDLMELSERNERSLNGEMIYALKLYVNDRRICSLCKEMAEIHCQIGKCAPGKWYCSYHYAQIHLPEEERDEERIKQ